MRKPRHKTPLEQMREQDRLTERLLKNYERGFLESLSSESECSVSQQLKQIHLERKREFFEKCLSIYE